MISSDDLFNMIADEAFNGPDEGCIDYTHDTDLVRRLALTAPIRLDPRKLIDHRRFIVGIDWCRGYPDKLVSIKAISRRQRRLDRSSNVRRRKRATEMQRRRARKDPHA